MTLLLLLQGLIIGLLLFTAVGKGCDGPSAPQCFRRTSVEHMYRCEWISPYKNCRHYIHFATEGNEFPCPMRHEQIRHGWTEIRDECLFQNIPVEIWVETFNCSSNCKSPKTRVTLKDTIKYEKPQNVSVTWSLENMTLQWRAPEKRKAAVQIQHRANDSPTWNNITRETPFRKNNKYALTLINLKNNSAQQLKMRHKSTEATNSLWSNWANVLTAPIEFTRISKERMKNIITENKTQRKITLMWKPVPKVNGEDVHYQVEIESFKDCPCHKHEGNTSRSSYQTLVSFSALNLSVRALNTASFSPPALFHVPPENPPDLKLCNSTGLSVKIKQSCSEWYELQDGKVKEDTVITLRANKKAEVTQKIEQELKDFLPYLYFEHRCIKKTQRTIKKCLYYKKQGQPESPPQGFRTLFEKPDTLLWSPIPTKEQRGFITHYSLCIQTSSEDLPDCRKIPPSLSSYTLKGLSPGTKYNISLSGFTEEGEGPKARIIINTQPAKPYNVGLSFGLLVSFFVLSTSCTFVFTRIKNKLFPPVPTPVIPGFNTAQAEIQALLERKEEVDKVTLTQLRPECCPLEETEERLTLIRTLKTAPSHLKEEWEDEGEDRRSQTGSEDGDQTPKGPTEEEVTDPEQIQNEIALLIYRNGLVFDVNVDSS